MMHMPTSGLVHGRFVASLVRFRDDERGAMAFFILFMLILMMMFGGIAVDVMRFETRRVAMQQTLDRATLAAASLNQTRSPEVIARDWFTKVGLGDGLAMVEFSNPDVVTVADAGLRRVTMSAKVRSYNFFMNLADIPYLEGPTVSEAAQGVSNIEVMLVLDITGSMDEKLSGGKTKIQGLREAATEFVNLVKANDKKNGVSIGMVPYSAQVNIPVALRNQFNVTNISSWDGVTNAGVPNINCIELPTSEYAKTEISRTLAMPMMAVADARNDVAATSDYISPVDANSIPNPGSRPCSTLADDPKTAWDDTKSNLLLMPSKNTASLLTRISQLTAGGNTSIAVGMRWGVGMLDQDARPIYTAIGDSTVQGRPANDDSVSTRKIIILMTDGSHVTNSHVRDAYKSGPSPIWLGTDGNYAMRFWAGGTDLNDNAKPTTCSGFPIAASREYFVPHMKDNSETARRLASEVEGLGTGARTTGGCDPNAWFAAPTWPQTVADGPDADDERDIVTVPDGPDADLLPDVVMVTATRLDWSEVWRYLRVNYVSRQFYMRSDVTGTNNNSTNMNLMRATYMSSVSNLDSLLQQNCEQARKDAKVGGGGVEIYGIAFAAPAEGQAQISGCSSAPKENYYFNATDNTKLLAAFRQIATDISDLRLTQ
jgi:Flp pilus assembly protein TadG